MIPDSGTGAIDDTVPPDPPIDVPDGFGPTVPPGPIMKTGYGWSDARIGRSFPFEDVNGHHALLVETVATGTSATVQIQEMGSGTIYVSVDGGNEIRVGAYTNTGAHSSFILFTNKRDAAHDLSIRITGVADYDAAQFLQVTGAAPSIALPQRFGPTYYFLGNAFMQSDGAAHLLGAGAGSGNSILVSGGIPGGRNVGIRFRATIASLRVMGQSTVTPGKRADGSIRLLRRQPGSFGAWTEAGKADLSYTRATEWKFGATVTGLDGASEWEYQVVYVGRGSWYLAGIGVAGAVDTAALDSQGYVVFWGDSITADYPLANSSEGFVYKTCRDLGLTAYNAGGPGETVAGAVARSASFGPALTSAPRAIVVLEGVNDNIDESGDEATAFQAEATATLGNFAAAWPTARGVVMGILPKTGLATHPRTDAAWAAAAQSANYSFSSTTGWIVAGPPDILADGVHPTAAADTKIAARLVPLLGQTLETSRAAKRSRRR